LAFFKFFPVAVYLPLVPGSRPEAWGIPVPELSDLAKAGSKLSGKISSRILYIKIGTSLSVKPEFLTGKISGGFLHQKKFSLPGTFQILRRQI